MAITRTTKMLKTPLHIQVGDIDTYSFITLMNLYDKCLEDPKYFDRLVDAATADTNESDPRKARKQAMDRLGKFLLEDGQVLPRKCFVVLFTLLCNEDLVEVIRKLLKKKYTWEQMQTYTPTKNIGSNKKYIGHQMQTYMLAKNTGEIWCAWPECPDEAS